MNLYYDDPVRDQARQQHRLQRLQGLANIPVAQAPAESGPTDYARMLSGTVGGGLGYAGGQALLSGLGFVPGPVGLGAKALRFGLPLIAGAIGSGALPQAIDAAVPGAHEGMNHGLGAAGPWALPVGAGLTALALMRRGKIPAAPVASKMNPASQWLAAANEVAALKAAPVASKMPVASPSVASRSGLADMVIPKSQRTVVSGDFGLNGFPGAVTAPKIVTPTPAIQAAPAPKPAKPKAQKTTPKPVAAPVVNPTPVAPAATKTVAPKSASIAKPQESSKPIAAPKVIGSSPAKAIKTKSQEPSTSPKIATLKPAKAKSPKVEAPKPVVEASRNPEYPEFAKNVLANVPHGTPGVSTEDVTHRIGKLDIPGKRVVYRDAEGKPVAVATLVDDGNGLAVKDFATDKNRGVLGGTAAVHVGKELESLGAARPTGAMSPDAERLMEHAKTRSGKPVAESTKTAKPKAQESVAEVAPPKTTGQAIAKALQKDAHSIGDSVTVGNAKGDVIALGNGKNSHRVKVKFQDGKPDQWLNADLVTKSDPVLEAPVAQAPKGPTAESAKSAETPMKQQSEKSQTKPLKTERIGGGLKLHHHGGGEYSIEDSRGTMHRVTQNSKGWRAKGMKKVGSKEEAINAVKAASEAPKPAKPKAPEAESAKPKDQEPKPVNQPVSTNKGKLDEARILKDKLAKGTEKSLSDAAKKGPVKPTESSRPDTIKRLKKKDSVKKK